MLVTDRALCPLPQLPALVAHLVENGVDAVQLREKDLPASRLLDLGRKLRAATEGRALLFVNGSVEVALACGADGVQLGEEAGTVAETWARAGTRLIIGRSVHGLRGARTAEAEGADLLVLGTIFPSRSHPGGKAAGPALVSDVTASVRLPVIGIGGIDATKAAEVIRAGATGVAVISAILAAADPAAAARSIRSAVDAERGRTRVCHPASAMPAREGNLGDAGGETS
jgi:thiamine-phosphate diphosphorylase